jgi:hypothetical protein
MRSRDAAAGTLQKTRDTWPALTAYERFEQVVSEPPPGRVQVRSYTGRFRYEMAEALHWAPTWTRTVIR